MSPPNSGIQTDRSQKYRNSTHRFEMPDFTDDGFGWSSFTAAKTRIWIRGHIKGKCPATLATDFSTLEKTDIEKTLDNFDGHYSIIVDRPDWSFAASDPVRTYPLLWTELPGGGAALDHDGTRLVSSLGLNRDDINPEMATAFALSGFTIGDRTLYRSIGQLGPGKFLLADEYGLQTKTYHRWQPWTPGNSTMTELADTLSHLNTHLIEDLAASAAGRPIIVPLSAGLDSRFIVSGLIEAGYQDVRTFSYGLPGNREAEIARDIAGRLGVPWTFVPYTNAALRQMFHSDGYRAFMAYSDSLTSIHFPQEYFALDVLKSRGWLPEDAIMVNGQSGDFIAGNHIPQSLHQPDFHASAKVRQDRVISALITKHFKHWQSLNTPDRQNGIRELLEAQIKDIGGMPDDPRGDHGVYEYCEFYDRQSKYVINYQRLYEFLGLDWRLPLWERSYLDFWEKVPLEAKIDEKLYREVLTADNWGGVWRDIPVNPTRIRPRWMVPVRHLFKLAHAPLGREAWHRFEKQYLDYFMATTCAYAFVPYSRVATDRRGHYSAIGWHIEAYLNAKGLAFDGIPAGD